MKVALALLALALSLPACGDGQSVDTGLPTSDAAVDSKTESATDTTDDTPVVTAKVTVLYGTKSTTVDVGALPTVDYKGSAVVRLDAVWTAAALGGELGKLEFDFEGDDGFHPSSKDKCKANIKGSQLDKGYILPATRSLFWDDSLGLPGCYSVRFVAKISALDAATGDAGADGG